MRIESILRVSKSVVTEPLDQDKNIRAVCMIKHENSTGLAVILAFQSIKYWYITGT